ncbi:unnamed protein product [Meganyctiphanes norvegica]|uniref:Uncharacterized protein n=1 Tax=Meganyctiphanes norvegica TaxID=48144 RepID=A0AAV2SNX7_MEGNR
MDPHMTPETAADLEHSGVHRRVLRPPSSMASNQRSNLINKTKKLVTFAKEKKCSGNSGVKEAHRCNLEQNRNSESLTFVVPERRGSIPTIPTIPTIAYLSPGDNNNPTVSVTTATDDYSGNNININEPDNLNLRKRVDKNKKGDILLHLKILT